MEHEQSPPVSRAQLELDLGQQLNGLISASHALHVEAAARFDSSLQPAAFHIVRWLYSFGPANAAALAEAIAMDRSSVSRLVKRLEALGYVRKEASPDDGRGVVLSLTDTGRQNMILASKEKESVFYERITSWTDAELQNFIDMLRRLNGLEL